MRGCFHLFLRVVAAGFTDGHWFSPSAIARRESQPRTGALSFRNHQTSRIARADPKVVRGSLRLPGLVDPGKNPNRLLGLWCFGKGVFREGRRALSPKYN